MRQSGSMRSGQVRYGYTMTELLVSMLILLILAALLLPALGRVREQARRTQCRTVLRQYATVVQLYANDNGGYLPAWFDAKGGDLFAFDLRLFWELTGHYLSGGGRYYPDTFDGPEPGRNPRGVPVSMVCPSAGISYEGCRSRLKEMNLYAARPTRSGSYQTALFSRRLLPNSSGGGSYPGGQRLNLIPSPSTYFVIEDAGFNDKTDDREHPYWCKEKFIDGHYHWAHGKFYNVAFLDGHVRGYDRKRRRLDWQADFTRDFTE